MIDFLQDRASFFSYFHLFGLSYIHQGYDSWVVNPGLVVDLIIYGV
jgi:hypothetical protein